MQLARVKSSSGKVFIQIVLVSLGSFSAYADLSPSYQFNGRGNWSLDAIGSNAVPVGTITATVPPGSSIEKAFLYSSARDMMSTVPVVDFDGTTYGASDFVSLGFAVGSSLEAFRADVTNQIRATIGGGATLPFQFVVRSENASNNIDGECLVIVYSNSGEAIRTIAILDGFSPSSGTTTILNYASPLPDPTSSGFEALLSLGIGYGHQAVGGTGQVSLIDINGRRLTSAAGGQDDGEAYNGGLITMGGDGDSPLNPPDPFASDSGGARSDDELYNIALGNGTLVAPFLATGETSTTVFTTNPSNDDNIFFLGLNLTAIATVGCTLPDLVPTDLDNTLRLIRSGLDVWMSWTSTPNASTYRLYRQADDKTTWPPVATVTGLTATTTQLPDIPAVPDPLLFYRVVGANCSGVEGP